MVPSCIVTEHTYVSTDPVYGPTGLSLLQADTLFIIPRDALSSPRYTANLTQPGQADISWSFNVAGNGGVDTNLGGNGNDMVFGDNGPGKIWGDLADDTIYGSAGNDVMYGR